MCTFHIPMNNTIKWMFERIKFSVHGRALSIVEQLPYMVSCGSGTALCCLWYVRSWILELCNVLLVWYRSGMLPQHLDFIFNVSDVPNATALASMWLYDLVSQSSHFRSADPSRSRFCSSLTMWRVRLVDGTLRIVGGWCGYQEYNPDSAGTWRDELSSVRLT